MPKSWLWLVVAVLVAGVIWYVLPDTVVAFNDDFGYLKSVVETVQHGRSWTDDWLEPWAASLSVVASFVYKATGSFLLATQGLQAVGAGVAFLALAALLKRRGLPVWATLPVSLVVLFCPTLMVKWVEFTALVIYVPCLLWALYLAERKRWVLFFLVWALAVTSRQSALAWLAWPGVAVFHEFWPRANKTDERGQVFLPMVVCLAGVAVYWWMARTMNVTHAQQVMTAAMWRSLSLDSLAGHFVLAAGVFLASAGCGAFVQKVFSQSVERTLMEAGGKRRLLGICVAFGVVGWFFMDPRTSVAFDHPYYFGALGRSWLGVVFGVAAAGWATSRSRFRIGHVVCAAGCGLLVSLRGAIYDYYLIDVAVVGLFSVGNSLVPSERVLQEVRRIWPWSVVGLVVCGILGGLEFLYVGKQQRILDRDAAVIRLCEPALRGGRIAPAELGVGPFGYYGWHLYPYFVRHEGARGEYIGDLEKYLSRGSLAADFTSCVGEPQAQDRLVREALGQDGVVNAGVFEIGWRGSFLFVLRRTAQAESAQYQIAPGQYRLEPFPLNDAEWREFVSKTQ